MSHQAICGTSAPYQLHIKKTIIPVLVMPSPSATHDVYGMCNIFRTRGDRFGAIISDHPQPSSDIDMSRTDRSYSTSWYLYLPFGQPEAIISDQIHSPPVTSACQGRTALTAQVDTYTCLST